MQKLGKNWGLIRNAGDSVRYYPDVYNDENYDDSFSNNADYASFPLLTPED